MKSKSRGNGQGSAYKRKNAATWTAQVIVGWKIPEDPEKRPIPVKRTKSGFKTKKDALVYCQSLFSAEENKKRYTLRQVYEAWEPFYSPRVGKTTMVCYESAYKHFAPLHGTYMDKISAGDLQECMDSCTSGKRTHQNMKCVAGLLWAYALDRDIVEKDVTQNLYIGKGETVQRDPITEEELETIRTAIPTVPFAEYVYALCYLGFRPGEFLKLKKTDLHKEDGLMYLVGGSKTEAGKQRRVPVPDAIRQIITDRKNVPGTDLLFPQYVYNRSGEFTGYKPMSDAYFRESIFKPMMAELGIAEGKVPYCARHTYSDKLKKAVGDDKTKAAIFGHTDYNFTKKRYQSTDLNDIKTVAESIK